MMTEKSDVFVINCSGKGFTKSNQLTKLMKRAYEKLGGESNVSPYLLRMSNHNINKNFISGGMISKRLSILLDYTPELNYLQLKIISQNGIDKEDFVRQIQDEFPSCIFNL